MPEEEMHEGEEGEVSMNDVEDGFQVVSRKKKKFDEHVLALDCEMCYTEDGLECTRVTIVNDRLETIYDKLVKPEKPIIDYNTR